LPDFLLVTRPEPGASETAARLAALGFFPVLAPMLTIVSRAIRLVHEPQAVLVTSGNALPALPAELHRTKLLAVGDATAARAKAAGFTAVHSAGRDAAALETLAARLLRPPAGPLLLASGAGQGRELAAALRSRGFAVVRRVAYAARPATALPEPARAALADGTIRAALFFSPATARAFVTILQRDMPARIVQGVVALAISPNTATALNALPWRQVRVASHPDQDGLLTLLP
jgi:uroporphyrinogen-III synthase